MHPSVARAGVFVDAPLADVSAVASEVGLDWVQLQGSEDPAYVAALRAADPTLCVAKVIRLTGPAGLAEALRFPADAVMLDSKDPQRPHVAQGSLPAAWLAEAQAVAPPGVRLIVAGGLTPATVAAVVAAVRPWGVDVSGGVEESPGRKDPVRMGEFVHAVRTVGAHG